MHHRSDALVMNWLKRRLGRVDLNYPVSCTCSLLIPFALLHDTPLHPFRFETGHSPLSFLPRPAGQKLSKVSVSSFFPFPFLLGLGWMGCNLSFSFILGFEISSILWIVLFKHVSFGLIRGEEGRAWKATSSTLNFGPD